MIIGILAGGSGKRFWPLSRESNPKQFLNIYNDKSLLVNTYERFLKISDKSNIMVISPEKHGTLIKRHLKGYIKNRNIIFEPMKRNTGPAIAYIVRICKERFGSDTILGLFPADHYIKETNKFVSLVKKADRLSQKTDKIYTLGIKPVYPSTEYGYINIIKSTAKSPKGLFKVKRFVEKPDVKTAKRYYKTGKYFWNGGMFIGKISVFENHFKKYSTDIYENIFNSPITRIDKTFKNCPDISVDYAIMEKSNSLMCIETDIGWNDIGNWESLKEILKSDKDGNVMFSGEIYADNSNNNIIINQNKSKPLISGGINNCLIVNMEDVVFIENLNEISKIKNLLKKLEKRYPGIL